MLSQTFTAVSQQRWDDIKTAIQEKTGVQITEDQGHSKYEGVTFSWAWGGTDLVVDIVSVSFGDEIIGETEQKVMGQFAAWIDGVQ